LQDAISFLGGTVVPHALLGQIPGHAEPAYQVSAQPGACRNVGIVESDQLMAAYSKPSPRYSRRLSIGMWSDERSPG